MLVSLKYLAGAERESLPANLHSINKTTPEYETLKNKSVGRLSYCRYDENITSLKFNEKIVPKLEL